MKVKLLLKDNPLYDNLAKFCSIFYNFPPTPPPSPKILL